MEIIKHIKDEWAVLKSAPLSFVFLLVLGLGGGFALGMFFRGQEVANLEALMRLKDGQLDDYKKTIEQRLDDFDKRLSAQQVSAIQEGLKSAPATVDIYGSWGDGQEHPDYAAQLKDAFTNSGWLVHTLAATGQANDIVIRPPDRKSAEVIKDALQSGDVLFTTGGDVLTTGAEDIIVKSWD